MPFDDPEAVKAMLQYLYTFDYDMPEDPYEEDKETAEENIESRLRSLHEQAVERASLLRHLDEEDIPDFTDYSTRIADELEVTVEDDTELDYLPIDEAANSLASNFDEITIQEEKDEFQEHNMCPMLFHIKVYALADRIQNPALKDLAERKFESIVSLEWKSREFSSAIQSVYSVAPPGPNGDSIRKTVIRLAVSHARDLFSLDRGFSTMLQETPEFGKDLAMGLCGAGIGGSPEYYTDLEELKCPKCAFVLKATLTTNMYHLSCPICKNENTVRKWRQGGVEKDKTRRKKRSLLTSTEWEL
jgi:hypothetical protein